MSQSEEERVRAAEVARTQDTQKVVEAQQRAEQARLNEQQRQGG